MKLTPIISALVLTILRGFAATDQQTMLGAFTVSPGLEAKIWAETYLIHSPVAIDVDVKGRLWVIEDLQRSGEKRPHARIKILEDTDDDGSADSVKVSGPAFGSKLLGISVFEFSSWFR
ncbi:MAG: hypothetical protein ACI9E1_001312 [Cryomorphaceae bacterium]|jgi:hypothetical protein